MRDFDLVVFGLVEYSVLSSLKKGFCFVRGLSSLGSYLRGVDLPL